MPSNLTQDQLLLINLLLRIGVMAGIVSLVLGFRFVVQFLTRVSITPTARIKMILLMASVFVLGIIVRKLVRQGPMDLALEASLVAGFLGGIWVGGGVGAAIGAVCYSFGEILALPLYTAAGIVSGLMFTVLRVRGEIWSYSLNPFLIIYNFIERIVRGRLDRNFIPFVTALVFAMVRYGLLNRYGPRQLLYGFDPQGGFLLALDLLVLVYTIGIALKMANNTRLELVLREEEKQLISARLTTLRSQINPHFLFNTLNSISALIRTDSEKAREMTRRLSSIFRRSLEDSRDTHTLREEIDFVQDYLSIEKVRFGDEKLKISVEADPAILDIEVPAMILQPVVENAVKHGISRRMQGGSIVIRCWRSGEGVDVEVENDGPVKKLAALGELLSKGMGLKNVIERLQIYSCGEGRFAIESRENGGAVVRLYVPEIVERKGGIVADQDDYCR